MKNLTNYDLKELNNLLYDLSFRISEYSHLENVKVYETLKANVANMKEQSNEEINKRQSLAEVLNHKTH